MNLQRYAEARISTLQAEAPYSMEYWKLLETAQCEA